MLIEPIKIDDGSHWIIASNPRPMTNRGVRVDVCQPEPVVLAWDWCWTGESWTSTAERAERFASRDAAQRYIDEHAESLTAAFEAAPG
jgi:hypothetical protein